MKKLDCISSIISCLSIIMAIIIISSCEGDGTYPGNVSFTLSFAIATGDLNGDGLNDVVIGHSGVGAGSYTAVRLQNPASPGTFAAASLLAVRNNSPTVKEVTIGDLNGDGKRDIVTRAAVNYSTQDSAFSLALADLNGDGLDDLAVAASSVNVLLFQDPGRPGVFFLPFVLESG